MSMQPKLSRLALLGIVLVGSVPSEAQTVTFTGADTSTHGSWRTSTVVKSLDSDGDNIYGTDGYYMLGGAALTSAPSYASVTRLTANVYGGNTNYTNIDNPTGAGTVRTGVWYNGNGGTSFDDFARIDVSTAGSFRLGIYTNNTDFANISPDQLRVRQTIGGAVESGAISSPTNRLGDWYFFDVVNAKVGDRFVISGRNINGGGDPGSNGIGAVTFDRLTSSAAPEPGTLVLVALGGAIPLFGRRRRR